MLIYFTYSENHQYEYFLGKDGPLRKYIDHIGIDNRRETYEAFKLSGEKIRTEKPFERYSNKRWSVSNMSENLPLIVVFTKYLTPVQYYLSKPYRKRVRDKKDIEELVNEIIRVIEARTRIYRKPFKYFI